MQYTRVYVDSGTGEVVFIHTQTTPIADGFEPMTIEGRTLDRWDMEIGSDTEPFINARDLVANIDYAQGFGPKFKNGAEINLPMKNKVNRGPQA